MLRVSIASQCINKGYIRKTTNWPIIAPHIPCLLPFQKQLHLSEPLVYPNQLYVSHGIRIIEVLLYYKEHLDFCQCYTDIIWYQEFFAKICFGTTLHHVL